MGHKTSHIILLKFELLYLLFTNGKVQPFIEALDLPDLLAAHRFLAEKTVELGIKIKGKNFPHQALTERLRAIAKTHINHHCPALQTNCNVYECAEKYPDCARKIAMKQILAMYAMSRELIFGS